MYRMLYVYMLSIVSHSIFVSFFNTSLRLASLPWHLGEFLALTGWTLRGYELVALDLVEHWLSPEALPFLELTSEKQLEEGAGSWRSWVIRTMPL